MKNNERISEFFKKIGMNNTYIGYCYWCAAIDYYISLKKDDIYKLVKIEDIYKYLSVKYNTTRDRVEKAMRFAKEKSNYIEKLKLDRKLKNKEFLITCANKLLIK